MFENIDDGKFIVSHYIQMWRHRLGKGIIASNMRPAQIITQDEMRVYCKDFDGFDVDSSGFLEKDEIRKLFKEQLQLQEQLQ